MFDRVFYEVLAVIILTCVSVSMTNETFVSYNSSEYDSDSTTNVVITVTLLPVVRKCCKSTQIYDTRLFYCKTVTKEDAPNLEEQIGHPECGVNEAVVDVPINEDGIKLWLKNNIDTELSSRRYCAAENVLRICRPKAEVCGNRSCFRKCCPLGQSYLGKNCINSEKSFVPTVYDLSKPTEPTNITTNFGFLIRDVCINKKFPLNPGKHKIDENFYGSNGILYVPGRINIQPQQGMYPIDDYCLEHVETPKMSGVFAFLCIPITAKVSGRTLRQTLFSVAFIISSVFFVLTIIVYLCLPKLMNLYGKTVICYLLSSFMFCCVNFFAQLKYIEDKNLCQIIGYLLLFPSLSAYCWSNVMAIDIWNTFRNIRVRSKNEKKKFILYSLYAWGTPIVITGICAVIDYVPNNMPEWLKPNMGRQNKCWFQVQQKSIFLYYVTPTAIIMIVNTVLYVITAWKCSKVKAEIERMQTKGEVGVKKKFMINRTKLVMNVKLFVVMGVTWSLEIVSQFVVRFYPDINHYWIVVDIANALQGPIIFAIFILKRKVLRELSEKICKKQKPSTRAPERDAKTESERPRYQLFRRTISSFSSTGYTTSTVVSD